MTLRIGTRGSALALWQATEVQRLLGGDAEIVMIKTTGDKRQDVPLASIGGKGVFIKELEEALDRDEIDLAVHSLKDVPSLIPDRFQLTAFLERADPRDAWLQAEHVPLAAMSPGSIIGTSAPRRRAQLLARWPQLRIEPMRGNVDTRLAKIRDGGVAGAVLASAGLHRLGRHDAITSLFDVDEMIPAAGQGIVAIETRRGDDRVRHINHEPTERAALCERGVLQKFGETLDCYSAVAVHATIGEEIDIRAFFGELEGTRAIRVQHRGRDAEAVVDAVYRDLVGQGAMELLRA